MRSFAVALIALAFAGPAIAQDAVQGLWQTQSDEGSYAHVQIAPCGAGFCGTIQRTFNAQGEFQSPNGGKQILREMVPQGGGKYEGKVWRPSNDKIYSGKLELTGNSLQMAGCVAGGLICSRQTWTRVR